MEKKQFKSFVDCSITSRSGIIDRDKLFSHIYYADEDFFKGASNYIRAEIGEITSNNEDDLYIELSAYCVDYYEAIFHGGIESLKISEFLDFMKEEIHVSNSKFFHHENITRQEFDLITEELEDDNGLIRKEELLDFCYENNCDFVGGFYDYYAVNFVDNFDSPLTHTALDRLHVELLAFADKYSKATGLDIDFKKIDLLFEEFKKTHDEVIEIKKNELGEAYDVKPMLNKDDYLTEITALLNGDKEPLRQYGYDEKVYDNDDSLSLYFAHKLMSSSDVHSGYFIKSGYGLDVVKEDEAHLIFYRDVGVEYIVNHSGDVYMAFKDDCALISEGDKNNMFYKLATQYYGFKENQFVVTDEEVLDRRKEMHLVTDQQSFKRSKMKI